MTPTSHDAPSGPPPDIDQDGAPRLDAGVGQAGSDEAGPDEPEGGGESREDRARQAGAHLQRATLELIEAARAVLDVAEEAVREPGGVMTVLADTLGGLAEAVGMVAPGWAERARQAAPAGWVPNAAADDGTDHDGTDGSGDEGGPRARRPPTGRQRPDHRGVEHIRIS